MNENKPSVYVFEITTPEPSISARTLLWGIVEKLELDSRAFNTSLVRMHVQYNTKSKREIFMVQSTHEELLLIGLQHAITVLGSMDDVASLSQKLSNATGNDMYTPEVLTQYAYGEKKQEPDPYYPTFGYNR